ncbi:MAG: TRAP transporter TatT component family protein [Phormidium tanganyikae FI6-MK23]|jgi:hypothetical protein|nr:TRAP transporter TatT component family protein [Phormidium tanganyikae FI6-MK23]
MTQPASDAHYLLDRDELLRIRGLKLLTSARDYVFFALQVDYPGKLNPAIDVVAFCERWELEEGDLYKALGDLRKKDIVVSISSRLNLQLS